jgi:hypothetical protein
LANIVVIVDVFVDGLKAPESNAFIVVLPDTVVTEAAVGYVRQVALGAGGVGAGGVGLGAVGAAVEAPGELEPDDDLPEQAVPAATPATTSSTAPRHVR